MTTDSEAWVKFAEEFRRCEMGISAQAALNVAEWLDERERQKRGSFGTPASDSEGTVKALMAVRDRAIERQAIADRERDHVREERVNALMRLAAMERDRDEAREANKRLAVDRDKTYEAMCAAQREWDAAGRERDEQRARAEEAEARLATVRAAENDEIARLKALLKEALGRLGRALGYLRLPNSITEQEWTQESRAFLGRAKAAGYIPDGEAPRVHQSWCRGDHSEGACVSDLNEVDRGD